MTNYSHTHTDTTETAHVTSDGVTYTSSGVNVRTRRHTAAGNRQWSQMSFGTPNIPVGSTIDAVDLQLYCGSTPNHPNPELTITIDMQTAPPALSSSNDPTDRTTESTGVAWSATVSTDVYTSTPSLVSDMQEWIDGANYADTDLLVIMTKTVSGGNARYTYHDGTVSGKEPTISIDYTAPGGRRIVTPNVIHSG